MKIFLFYFEIAIKITGSAQNYRVSRVSGNTPIFRPNGKNVVTTLSPSFLIESSSSLQVTRTCMKAWISSNFGQIRDHTTTESTVICH